LVVGAVALGTLVFVPAAYASVTAPAAPTRVAATPGNGTAIVKWTAPANDGGSGITGYVVKSSPGSKTCTTTGDKTCTIRGLRNGTSYTVTAKARNRKGLGAASARVTVKPGVPLAPKDVRAIAGNARATVKWIAPANNGSSVRRYTVTSSPGTKTCTRVVTTCTLTGLTNGTRYRFKVTATNARGTGAASTLSAAATPHLPPTLTITASSGTQTYGGKPPLISPTYSGFVNGDSPADLTALLVCVPGTTSSSAVGSYASSCSGAVDPNYSIVYVDGTTSVGPATLTITASGGIQTYGGALPLISPTYSGFVNGDSPADLTALPVCVPGTTTSSPVVGSYVSSCSGAVGPNYSIVYVDGTTSVGPATLTITANPESKLLGVLDTVLTFVASGLIRTDTTTGSLTRTPGELLGRYAIELGTVTAGPNYTIVFVGNFLTIQL
jgi:hypothetical protein